jgi:hypothetical protein
MKTIAKSKLKKPAAASKAETDSTYVRIYIYTNGAVEK